MGKAATITDIEPKRTEKEAGTFQGWQDRTESPGHSTKYGGRDDLQQSGGLQIGPGVY